MPSVLRMKAVGPFKLLKCPTNPEIVWLESMVTSGYLLDKIYPARIESEWSETFPFLSQTANICL